MRTLRDFKRVQLWVLLVTACAWGSASAVGVHLIYNKTSSLPRGLYWVLEGRTPRRGDLIAFAVPARVRPLVIQRRYLPAGAYLLKPVVASEGDHVCTTSALVLVNGRVLGSLVDHDARGRPLPVYSICDVLRTNELYVASSKKNSFDSRAFGPVRVDWVRGVAVPLWTE